MTLAEAATLNIGDRVVHKDSSHILRISNLLTSALGSRVVEVERNWIFLLDPDDFTLVGRWK